MSRRFSDQPINLIHRIPTPEQLSAARPAPRSFLQAMLESGAACARGIAELFSRIPRACAARVIEPEPPRGENPERQARTHSAKQEESLVATHRTARSGVTEQPAPASSIMQADEIAELRGYLLTQQQDIARLAAQIHELKSLVIAQQQVLLYLGKDLEQSTSGSLPSGVASGPSKRHRPVREKSSSKERPVVRKEGATQSSFSL